MTTYSMKASEISKDWYVIDAEGLVLGRLASATATLLRGKHKPTYTPHMDCGDHIIIINADKIVLTGRKSDRNKGKEYFRHTGYFGGIKSTTAGRILEGNYPERVIKKAIERMFTDNNLKNDQLRNLYVYAGSEHKHQAQQPKLYDFAALNRKNTR